jgi:hydroxyacylglutathione hydrolase
MPPSPFAVPPGASLAMPAPFPGPATPPEGPATQVSRIPVLRDNYVFVLHGGGSGAVVVDPAVAEPVIAWLEQRGLELVAILHTHHHSDHIGGAPELLRRWPEAEVIASAADRARIPLQTRGVADGERLQLLGRELRVLAVPGHTHHHIAFHLPPPAQGGWGELFCGDTLFAGGCGRLFEGTAEQMHRSLGRLAALPESTRVWCAHEYTATNLAWAHAEAPSDGPIRARLAAVQQQRAAGVATVPSCIGLEKATNLFVRAADGPELASLRQSRNDWRS